MNLFIGFGTIINHPFWGPTPIFGNSHMMMTPQPGNLGGSLSFFHPKLMFGPNPNGPRTSVSCDRAMIDTQVCSISGKIAMPMNWGAFFKQQKR